MPKLKKVYTEKYTVISNRVLDDEELGWKAKGLFVYLWSRPDTWNFYVSELVKHSKGSRDQVMTGLKELERHGYLLRDRDRNESGQYLSTSTWLLSDEPNESWIKQNTEKSAKPKSENPTQENPTLENPTLLNTNNNKYLNNKVLSYSSLSKSPSKTKTVDNSKSIAIVDEREKEKLNQIMTYYQTQIKNWRPDCTQSVLPLSASEQARMLKAIKPYTFEQVEEDIVNAAITETRNPVAYLVAVLTNKKPGRAHIEYDFDKPLIPLNN